jgi:manganese-dependent inorganic pyrophosphatase
MAHHPTLVIGHKNPDTDAICSALGYAEFLQRSGRVPGAEAACCGVLNSRTSWALEQAGLTAPRKVLDVRPNAGRLCRREVVTARPDETFHSVYRRMAEGGYRSLPVIDSEGRPWGLATMLGLLGLVLPDPAQGDEGVRRVRMRLDDVAATLGARPIVAAAGMDEEEEIFLAVGASSAEVFARRTSGFPARRLVAVVADRQEIQEIVIQRGVRALILTGGFGLARGGLKDEAEARGVCVMSAPHDTGSTLQLIRSSRRVESAVERDFVCFRDNDSLRQIQSVVRDAPQRLFPVVDPDSGVMVGVLSRSDLANPPAQRLVLVDHNEFSQAVDGADEAEVIEVLDHHRLSGDLVSREPVRFINEIVGSTSTIVARHFRDYGIEPSRGIAVCLAAGMISDTLKLSSPTTTELDRQLLPWLAEIGGIDVDEFAKSFFEVGSVLRESSPAEALSADRKEYVEAGWRVSISQIEELGLDAFWQVKDKLFRELDQLVEGSGIHFACLMVTDITKNDSILLAAGEEEIVDSIAFPRISSRLFRLSNVVSRKKQLFPYLCQILGKIAR